MCECVSKKRNIISSNGSITVLAKEEKYVSKHENWLTFSWVEQNENIQLILNFIVVSFVFFLQAEERNAIKMWIDKMEKSFV